MSGFIYYKNTVYNSKFRNDSLCIFLVKIIIDSLQTIWIEDSSGHGGGQDIRRD